MNRTESWIADVVSGRPVEIALEVRENARRLPFATSGLYMLDGSKPALREISFIPSSDDGLLRLRVVIPEDQISGSYSAVVVNQVTGDVQGTLTIKVKD